MVVVVVGSMEAFTAEVKLQQGGEVAAVLERLENLLSFPLLVRQTLEGEVS